MEEKKHFPDRNFENPSQVSEILNSVRFVEQKTSNIVIAKLS